MVMTWNLDIFLDVSLQNGTVAGNLLFACLFVLCVCVYGVGDTVVLGFCRLLTYREKFFFFFFFESVVIRDGLGLLGLLGKLLAGRGGTKDVLLVNVWIVLLEGKMCGQQSLV